MLHLTDRTLEKLISGSASPNEVQRIRRHITGCRPCARRLEEWRDNFPEVNERFPELGADVGPTATMSSDGLVIIGSSESRPGFELDLTTSLWIGAALMALLVGYGTYRLRQAKQDVSGVATLTQTPHSEPESRPESGPQVMPRVTPGGPLTPGRSTGKPGAPGAPSSGSPRQQSTPGAVSVSPHFSTIRMAEAAQRLGGPIRLIPGLDVDHVEVGPATAVPGAEPGLDVIRVVYRSPDNSGRILLDQQLIPADSSGFRPIHDQTLESGQTAFGSTASGLSVATWLDDDGYRISLSVRASVDSLKRLKDLVH